jgi:ATP-dependent Lon protease
LHKQKKLPLLINQETVIFPTSVTHLKVSYTALNVNNLTNKAILAFQKKTPQIGLEVEIIQQIPTNNLQKLLIEGLRRVQITKITESDSNGQQALYQDIQSTNKTPKQAQTIANIVLPLFKKYLAHHNQDLSAETILSVLDLTDLDHFTDVLSSYLLLSPTKKQTILAQIDLTDRLQLIKTFIQKENKELDTDSTSDIALPIRGNEEINAYQKKITALSLPYYVEMSLLKEVEKLQQINESSYEAGNLRVYLDFVLNLPWHQKNLSKISIEKVQTVLNNNHFGLTSVKERILEHMAVTKLSGKCSVSNILCFVGPPGVGKTSLVKSIAKALNRKFIGLSLAGINDESELRGHRRVYVGANAGKIISSLHKVKTSNPVILLDEIDKIASNFKGDPSTVLLEILDPSQNEEFTDQYLQIPFDISSVFFICTANSLEKIPSSLLDRLEIIQIPGYTLQEKIEIAKNYILPKQLKNHGFKTNIHLSSKLVEYIILNYTSDSGLRDLQRNINQILRKLALKLLKKEKIPKIFSPKTLEKFIGPGPFKNSLPKIIHPGRSLGLYSLNGQENLLPIESAFIPGTGKLISTGNISLAVKETITVVISFLKQHFRELSFPKNFFRDQDIHIHFSRPDILKKGTDLGMAISASILSAIQNITLPNNLAFLGGISLTGQVFEVANLDQSLFAASQLGIKKIVIAKKNLKNITITSNLEIIYIDTLLELNTILKSSPKA